MLKQRKHPHDRTEAQVPRNFAGYLEQFSALADDFGLLSCEQIEEICVPFSWDTPFPTAFFRTL